MGPIEGLLSIARMMLFCYVFDMRKRGSHASLGSLSFFSLFISSKAESHRGFCVCAYIEIERDPGTLPLQG